MTKQQKTLEKISALLAKAESTEHDAEREALRAKAYELMARYGIEQVELAQKRKQQKQRQEQVVEWTTVLEGRPYMKQQRMLAFELVAAAGTMKLLRSTLDAHHEQIWVFGYESDVQAFRVMFDSLRMQALSAMNEWWKREGLEQHKHLPSYRQLVQRREFLDSFSSTVGLRMAAARSRAEKTHDSDTNLSEGSTALALRSRQDAADEFMRSRYNVGRGRSRATLAGSSASSAAGNAAGARANIGSSSVSTGARGAISA